MVSTGAKGEQVVALRLGIIEKGEPAQTGMKQGVLVDRPHVAEMVFRRAAVTGKGKGKPWICYLSLDRYRKSAKQAWKDAGALSVPGCSAQPLGLSHDAAKGHMTAWQI